MDQITYLKNTIQTYAWGSTTMIPELMGEFPTSGKPQAELWMGAHPKAPSLVKQGGNWVSLDQVIQQNPEKILGKRVAARYTNQLPYLLKVLAAEKPLSIQAHPTREQAIAGFQRENQMGISLDAPDRNYRDPNHKPECVCALSEYWALCGFRPIPEIMELYRQVETPVLDPVFQILQAEAPSVSDRLRSFFQALMTLPKEEQVQGVGAVVDKAGRRTSQGPVFNWVVKLSREYGWDIGVLSPLFLNLICLQPGEALFLLAGELHAYLHGLGIEVMANSDNVLRGGLTPKHMDVPELMQILQFSEKERKILTPVAATAGCSKYETRAEEFELSVIKPRDNVLFRSPSERSVEIMICVQGSARVVSEADQACFPVERGSSVIVPAAAPPYRITGEGTLYRVAVPNV